MRHAAVAIVMVALTLAGVGRGLASAPFDAIPAIPGVTLHICHAGDGGGSGPADPSHDCCDACVLGAPVIAAGSPAVPVVSPVAHDIVRSALVTWVVRLSRARSPRQSQGPPAA